MYVCTYVRIERGNARKRAKRERDEGERVRVRQRARAREGERERRGDLLRRRQTKRDRATENTF
jgi:hypothetical protein